MKISKFQPNISAQSRGRQTGFTIIEVLLGLLIVSVMLVIYVVSINTLKLNEIVRDRELALRIAGNEIETLRATPFNSLPASGSFADPLLSSLSQGAGAITVSALNASTKQVTVTVTWHRPATPADSSISLVTLITQGGL